MSLDPILWALKDAPTADVNEFAVLVCLAEHADEDGCDSYPSTKTIAAYTKISRRTVQRCLSAMESRGLIAEGNQAAARHIPAHVRPTVYDLLVPCRWFNNPERTNAFRTSRGRPPITRLTRPDIVSPPPRKCRTDKGVKKRGNAGSTAQGRLVVTPVENPEKGVTTSHPVTCSPGRGDYKSKRGRLVVTQTTPTNRTDEPPRPSVGSTDQRDGTDGRVVDAGSVKTSVKTRKAAALRRTDGVDLLLGVGLMRPELVLTGKVLSDQGLMVDGLLSVGWPAELLAVALARPLPPDTRSVGAIISRRLKDLSTTPVPRPVVMPAPRHSVEESDGDFWQPYEEQKPARRGLDGGSPHHRTGTFHGASADRWRDCGQCADPIFTPTGTDLCAVCLDWPLCPSCEKRCAPGARCETCGVVPSPIEFDECEAHGDRFVRGTGCFQCSAP